MPLTEEQRHDYVQDAEAFFAIMRRAGQWDGLLPDAVNLWLENFDTPPLRYFACRILRGLLYYSERDTETLLREGLNHQVLGRLVRMEHQIPSAFSCYPSLLNYHLTSARQRTLLVPLTTDANPSESALQVTRVVRKRLHFPSANICFPNQLVAQDFSKFKHVVVVDDNVGSGAQFREFWENCPVDGTTVGRYLSQSGATLHYLVLIGTASAVAQLRTDFPEVDFRCAQNLPDNYGVFAPASVYWPDAEEQAEAQQAVTQLVEGRGVTPVGWNGMTYAAVLHQIIPDWCLPALWQKTVDWTPLIELSQR